MMLYFHFVFAKILLHMNKHNRVCYACFFRAKLLDITSELLPYVTCSQHVDEPGVAVPIAVLSCAPCQESDIIQVVT